MNCCDSSQVQGTNKFFSKHSARYLKQFRKKGLAKEQKYIVEGIEKSPVGGKSILDIGCGAGGLHITMLKHGAASAVGVDMSEGMLEGAKHFAREFGFENQTKYLLGDVVEMNGTIGNADIVVLDKVVCCYEHLDKLLDASLSRTKEIYALSFPASNLMVKISFYGLIFIRKLFKAQFRPYWHDWEKMVQKIRDNGFSPVHTASTFFWSVYVFQRG